MALRLARWTDTGSPEATATLPKGALGGKGEIPKQIGEVRSVCIVMTATRIPIALEGVRSLILLHTMV